MTIPIVPGPFSFLAGAGRALGAYADAKEKKRQTQVKEANDILNQMIRLRQAGLLKPDAFATPEAEGIYRTLGITPVSAEATPDEQVTAMKGEFLTNMRRPDEAQKLQIPIGSMGMLGGQGQTVNIPGKTQYSDEQRAIIGAPQRGLTEKINADVATSRAAIPQAALTGATATAALPGAGVTAIAGQQSEQDKQYGSVADRVVRDLFAKNKNRLPTSAQAYAAGQADERTKPFGTAITEPYYGAAIERLRQEQYGLVTDRVNANARAQGAAGSGMDDLIGFHQKQQERLTDEMKALPEPQKTDFAQHSVYAKQMAEGKKPSSIMKGAYERVEKYNTRVAELQQQLQQSRDQTSTILQRSGLPIPPANPPGTSGSPQKRAAADEYERLTKGMKDPGLRRKVAERLAKKYGINLGAGK